MINHRAELALHQYMERAVKGTTSMSKSTIKQVANDVAEALERQFNGGNKRDKFKLRMSNLGRPSCQLWFEKNHPQKALPKPTTFIMNMMIGDIVEAVFKGLLTESGIEYENSRKVTLQLDDTSVDGTFDLVVDNRVDDVKSSSNWSYIHKFESYEKLKESDTFGYVGQLAGYAKAMDKEVGGWWVVNKTNGDFKYVSANEMDVDEEVSKFKDTIRKLKQDKVERAFEPERETFNGKETGNLVLNKNCTFCSYRHACWPDLQELPAVMSKAKQPKITSYIKLQEEYTHGTV